MTFGDDGDLVEVLLEEPELAVTSDGEVVLAEDLPVVEELPDQAVEGEAVTLTNDTIEYYV